jgi:hypothetical protein
MSRLAHGHHVLAVHGWFGSAPGWGALPEYVDRDDFTYVFMNLRGYAGALAPAPPADQVFHAQTVSQLEDRVQAHARAICGSVFIGPEGIADFAKETADLPLLTLADRFDPDAARMNTLTTCVTT